MNTFHIGLDFGTYQSKACVYDLDKGTHEFFRFNSNSKYFQPSRVGLKRDGTVEYGSIISGLAVEEFYYFKILNKRKEIYFSSLNYSKTDFHPSTTEADMGLGNHGDGPSRGPKKLLNLL